jgi:peptide-methionine (R)-S-oxide reductase
MTAPMNMSDAEWRERLTPEQYKVLRQAGTEPPFSGKYVDEKTPGMYTCGACGQILFSSDTKYDSHCGWPSFYDVLKEGVVELREDASHGMVRTEVVCSNCGSHLGHVFDDGPTETTGKRYCINSLAIDLKPDET